MTYFPTLPAPNHPPVIVGGGNAGLAAAARFSQRGVQCILIEKQQHLGGQLLLSGGHFSGAGTRRQQARGIKDTASEHADDVLRIGHFKATPYLVRLATRHAATAIDWIEELGFPFDDATPAIVQGHEPYSKPRTYWGTHDRNGGSALVETLEPALDRSIVDVRTGSKLTDLRTVRDGRTLRVTGVEIESASGTEWIETDTVILATGGYAASQELLARHQPTSVGAILGCLPHATGDGLRILEELDVPVVGGDTYIPSMGLIEDPQAPGRAFTLQDARVIVDANARLPWEIWINSRGERWVDETGLSPDTRERALLQQPDLSWWSVWNERALREAPSVPIGPKWSPARIRSEAAKPHSWIHTAPTLHALAESIEVDPPNLIATVNAYDSDEDPFGRVHRPVSLGDGGPYYAVRSTGAMLLSRGGPDVDDALRPRTAQGEVLHGVHAIGELLGMAQFSGDAFAGGMSVGPALTFGVLIADRISDSLTGRGQ